jgi:hypothetical protein
MLRLALSLLAAATITFGGYSALGSVTGPSGLKVIATVYSHARHHGSAISNKAQAPVISPG